MPKKISSNPKAVEARAKKEEAKKGKQEKADKEKDDQEWAQAGEGAKTKAQLKKDEQERARQEAAKKKAEAKKMAEEEEAALAAKPKKTPSKATGTPKVTMSQLRQQKEADKAAAEEAARQRDLETKRMVPEDTYVQLVDTANVNRDDVAVDARSVEAALAALSTSEQTPEDRHPEKRARAAFAAYSEAMMAELKEEKSGLKQSQYKDMIWKAWQKAPENPLNRPPST